MVRFTGRGSHFKHYTHVFFLSCQPIGGEFEPRPDEKLENGRGLAPDRLTGHQTD